MIIGLVGFIGSGKGSVADILTNKYGFIKESYANSVKDAVSTIFGWDRDLLEGETNESREWREKADPWWSNKLGQPLSPRYALQLLGTEAGRDLFGENLWVSTLEKRIDPNKNYVIADVRFPNEIKHIQSMFGEIVRVKRGSDPEWYDDAVRINLKQYGNSKDRVKTLALKLRDIDIPAHYSEWAWVGTDTNALIVNDGSFDSLEHQVDFLMRTVYTSGL